MTILYAFYDDSDNMSVLGYIYEDPELVKIGRYQAKFDGLLGRMLTHSNNLKDLIKDMIDWDYHLIAIEGKKLYKDEYYI